MTTHIYSNQIFAMKKNRAHLSLLITEVLGNLLLVSFSFIDIRKRQGKFSVTNIENQNYGHFRKLYLDSSLLLDFLVL